MLTQQTDKTNNSQFKNSPFNLDNDSAYQAWQARKLENYPSDLSELMVEINNPRQLSHSEHKAILDRCRVANMAIYVSQVKNADKTIPPIG